MKDKHSTPPTPLATRVVRPMAVTVVSLAAAALLTPRVAPGQTPAAKQELRLEKVAGGQQAFHVLSTLVVGPTESIVWDAQYRVSGGKQLADRIEATGTRLKAVVLSHADHDHYMGALEVVKRFPGTPVYMTRAGLKDFAARSQHDLAMEKRRGANPEVPDSLVTPTLLPEGPLYLDGAELVFIEGLTGDVRAPVSAALWIPSLRTVLAGDLVFEGIHPWLGDSDIESRKAWRASLRQLAELEPIAVVPGHKRDVTTPDSPSQLEFMIQYLNDYDSFMEQAATPDEVVEAMVAKYPDLELAGLMAYGAKKWFKQ